MNANDPVMTANGVNMPKILYGTAWKRDQTARLVEQAITLGFRGVDTACQPKHYHEPGVGAGLTACLSDKLTRADIYLQTKFTPLDGQDPKRIPYDPAASLTQQLEQSFQTSLRNLQTTYLDGLVLHSPYADARDLMEVWRAMEAICNDGGAKQLGISNCYSLDTLESLYRQAKVKPAVVQNRFFAETKYDWQLRQFCREHGIVYQSFWTLTANPHILTHDSVEKLAQRYGYTTEQIFFRYLTQIGIVPLTGTTSAAHMRDDLAIFDFALTESECAAVTSLLRRD